MFVKGFFTRYWRYLLTFVCGCAVITTGPACQQGRNGGGGSPLLIITSIASSNISSVGATISWSTNRPADSQTEYGVTTGYGNVVSLKTLDTNHQLTVFGLTPDTLYHYRVKSKDEAGNLSASGDVTFTTAKSGSPTPTPRPGPTPTPAPSPTPFPVGGVDEFVGPFPSWKNAKTDYGARGDGVTDDTAALQRGLNDLSSGGAVKTLFIPSGTYKITQTLSLSNVIYVNIIGEDPDFATIRWAGASGGIMMNIDGVAYSRFNRLTWDGQNSADVAVDQAKSDQTGVFDTGNEYAEDVFRDVGYGIRAGNLGQGASETSVVRSRFIHNTKAGIITKNFNALDWWVWFCYFEDCAIGVTNNPGAGNFSVYNSVFKRSTVADMMIGNTQFYSIRNNYSIGSKVFYNSPGAGQNGALTVIQGNTILDTQDPVSISISDFGPVNIYDNFIRSRVGSPGPAIKLDLADTLAFGNTFTISNQITAPGRHIFDGNQTVQPGAIVASEPVIPFKYVPQNRRVFEPQSADDVAIQQAINNASSFCGQRPIVHLPAAAYQINNPLIVPANCDIQIVGDGGYSALNWGGVIGGTVLTLRGPSKAILRDFRVQVYQKGNGIVIENADQPNSRVYMQEAFANVAAQNGLLVDGLDNTRVDLRGFQHQDVAGTSVKVVGGPSAAGGLPLGGRTTLISGASASNTLSYEVTQGARFVAKDVWYEIGGSTPRPAHIKLTGNSAVTFDQARIFTNPTNTTPPAIDIQNYTGRAVFIGVDIEDGINISGTSSGSVLGLGMNGHRANYFSNSTAAQAALVNSRWYDPTFGTRAVANIGSFDPVFLRDMLSQTRGANLSNEYEAIPTGITDVRIFRVYVESGIVGIQIKR